MATPNVFFSAYAQINNITCTPYRELALSIFVNNNKEFETTKKSIEKIANQNIKFTTSNGNRNSTLTKLTFAQHLAKTKFNNTHPDFLTAYKKFIKLFVYEVNNETLLEFDASNNWLHEISHLITFCRFKILIQNPAIMQRQGYNQNIPLNAYQNSETSSPPQGGNTQTKTLEESNNTYLSDFLIAYKKFIKLFVYKVNNETLLALDSSSNWLHEISHSTTRCGSEILMPNPAIMQRQGCNQGIPLNAYQNSEISPPSQGEHSQTKTLEEIWQFLKSNIKSISAAVIVLLALLISLYSPAIRSMSSRIYGAIRSEISHTFPATRNT